MTGSGVARPRPSATAYDSGYIGIYVWPQTELASYEYGKGDTAETVAAGLAAGWAGGSSFGVQQVGDGTSLAITYNQTGPIPMNPNNPIYVYTQSNDWDDFGPGSFAASGGLFTFTGLGENAPMIPSTVYQYHIQPPAGSSASGYYGNGNLSSYTDSVMGSWNFTYDGLNRLIGGTASPAVNENVAYCWAYDSFGNRTLQSGSSQAFQTAGNAAGTACQPNGSANVTVDAANYNAANQIAQTNVSGSIVSPQYDGDGNMTMDGTSRYLYDADGHLCAVGTPSIAGGIALTGYLYNAVGQRVAKGSITSLSCDPATNGFAMTNSYILGPGGETMTEVVPGTSQNNWNGWARTNVYANGSLLATYLPDGQGPHFRLTDWLGTKRAQTSYFGALEQTCQTLPFGDGAPCAGAASQFFTGYERDPETGLDYARPGTTARIWAG